MAYNELELQAYNRKEQIKNTHRLDLGAIMLDMGGLASVFALFTKAFLQAFLEEMGKFFLFPVAAAAASIRAVLAWREAYYAEKKDGPVVRAMVETAAAIAITTAVVGALAIPAIFAGISPIIFTATFGAKTVWHALSATYYLGKSFITDNEEKKTEYRERAKAGAMGALVGALGTAAIGAVMVFGKVALAPLGIVAGGLGMLYAGYKLYQSLSAPAAKPVVHSTLTAKPDEVEKTEDHSPKPSPKSRNSLDSTKRISGSLGSKQSSPNLTSSHDKSPLLSKKVTSTSPQPIRVLPWEKNNTQKPTAASSAPTKAYYLGK